MAPPLEKKVRIVSLVRVIAGSERNLKWVSIKNKTYNTKSQTQIKRTLEAMLIQYLTPSTSPKPTTPEAKQPKTPSLDSRPTSKPNETPPNPPYHPHNPHAPHSNNTAHAARSPKKSNCTQPCTASDSNTAIAPHYSSSAAQRSCWCAGWLVGTAGPWCSLLRRCLVMGMCRGNSSILPVG